LQDVDKKAAVLVLDAQGQAIGLQQGGDLAAATLQALARVMG
jgi:hypothetical protein